MRALLIGIVVALCACLPSHFDDLERTDSRRDASSVADAETNELEDAESAAVTDAAPQEPSMDAAAGEADAAAQTDAGRAQDAALGPDAGATEGGAAEGGAQDAATKEDATVLPTCLSPRISCAGACVDPRSDPAHCGSCGEACDPGYACVDRQCRSESGCSDNTREGFPDRLAFPDIAGCAAAWPPASMRALPLQSVCGNSSGRCNVPAEACARGWHVCGNAASGPADITARVTSTECNTTAGRWAGALGDFSCEDCSSVMTSGSVCCGAGCVQQNKDCLWPGVTAWFGVVNDFVNLCSGTENPTLYLDVGVLCCRDEPVDAGSAGKPGPNDVLF